MNVEHKQPIISDRVALLLIVVLSIVAFMCFYTAFKPPVQVAVVPEKIEPEKTLAQATVEAAQIQAEAISNAEDRAEEAAEQRQKKEAIRRYKAAERARYSGTLYSQGMR